MEEKFSCYVFLRITEVIEVTQEIINTSIIPLEALRAHLPKRPHMIIHSLQHQSMNPGVHQILRMTVNTSRGKPALNKVHSL